MRKQKLAFADPAAYVILAADTIRKAGEMHKAAAVFDSTPAEIAAALSVYRRVKAKRKKRKRP